MANGMVELFKLNGIMKTLDKIVRIRNNHGKNVSKIRVTNSIEIQFSEKFKVVWILVNGNKYIKYNYGNLVGGIKSLTTGLTAGIAEGAVSFETKNKNVMTTSYVKGVEEAIKVRIPEIENKFINETNKQWKR